MSGRRLLVPLCAGMLLLAGAAEGQIVRQGGAYRLRAKYTKGKSFRYAFDTLVTQLGDRAGVTRQNIALPVLMKVLEVKNGVAQIRNEIGPWKLDGKKFRDKTNVVVHVDAWNKIVRGPATEVPHFSVQLPQNPMKVGQSWSSTVSTAGATPQAIQVKATYTLKQVANGRASIGVGYSGASANSVIQTSGSGTIVLSTADASMVSMNVSQVVTLKKGVGARTQIVVKRVG